MRLSIIVPVFGVERYIARCLDSIFSLDISSNDYEVICVDDCSKDSSVAIIESYQAAHDNLILIHHDENKRQGGARNTGIKYATGEFTLFVDADDYLPKYDIASVLAYMRSNQLDLLIASADIKMEDRTIKRWGNAPICKSSIMKGPNVFTDEYIHKVAFGVVWIGIYKTALIKRMRPFVEKVSYEDADWTLQCAYEAKRLQYQSITIYNYVKNPASTTRQGSIQLMTDRLRQGLRVWQWALTVTQNQEAVISSAKDFCIFNLFALKSIWKYKVSERKAFYNSFTDEEWDIMKGWVHGRKDSISFFVTHHTIAQAFLCFISPLLRLTRSIKNQLVR